ncbi:MAG TPA: hypothetical protein VKV02_05455 [Acidobacteriaceae bacterium]|nr:hypothetical protein [Acidobacteriaceae bacterium]
MASANPEVPNVAGLLTVLPRGWWRRGLLATSIVLGALLLAWPFSGTTFGDDFSYAMTTLEFARTGRFVYNAWASALVGWQAVYGALWVKLFGFSFNILRISTMVEAFVSIFLCYEMLLRFRVKANGAFFGALTLGLTPLFFPLAASFMTDISGLLSILLCTVMCQRAASAIEDRAALGWIVAAAGVNVVTGSVRQICWLGALVMVPSTIWWLRRRRGMLPFGVTAWLASAAAIFWLLHWQGQQPWITTEPLFMGRVSPGKLVHLATQVLKAFLFLVLITAPVGAAWVARGPKLRTAAILRIVLLVAATVAVLAYKLHLHGSMENTLMPWLQPELSSQGMADFIGPQFGPVTLGRAARSILSVLTLALAAVSAEQMGRFAWDHRRDWRRATGGAFWILLPYSVCVVGLLLPRGMFLFLQDRYLLLLIPPTLVLLLRTYGSAGGDSLPMVCTIVLVVFAVYAVGGTHDEEAAARARMTALARLEAEGVPRTSVVLGFGPDEWEEVKITGHVNFGRSPSGEPALTVRPWDTPVACLPFNYAFTPHVRPGYIVTMLWGPCFVPSRFAAVPYGAWLPPFHRSVQTFLPAPSGAF